MSPHVPHFVYSLPPKGAQPSLGRRCVAWCAQLYSEAASLPPCAWFASQTNGSGRPGGVLKCCG